MTQTPTYRFIPKNSLADQMMPTVEAERTYGVSRQNITQRHNVFKRKNVRRSAYFPDVTPGSPEDTVLLTPYKLRGVVSYYRKDELEMVFNSFFQIIDEPDERQSA